MKKQAIRISLALLATVFALSSAQAVTLDNGSTYTYDNIGQTGTFTKIESELHINTGDNTVQLIRTAPHNVALQFDAENSGWANEGGKSVNFVIGGTPGVNGADSKIVISDLTQYRYGKPNPSNTNMLYAPNAAYFNGGDFAVYDAGPDGNYATPMDGFIRGINYGVDPNSTTSAGGATFTNTNSNQEITGSLTAQGSVTIGSSGNLGANNGTLKIVGASDITMLANGHLQVIGTGNTCTTGIIKTGGGTSTIGGAAGSKLTVLAGAQSDFRVDGADDVLDIAIPLTVGNKVRFMKTGAGTLALSSDITWQNLGQNKFYLNGGTFEIGGDATHTRPAGSALATQAGTLFRHNSTSTNSTHEGNITGAGGVEVANGMLTLNRADGYTYTGGTTVTGGTLMVTNTSGSGTGTGDVTIDGGFLSGTGSISGPITVNPGGAIAPGASIGILSGVDMIWNSDDLLAGMTFELGDTGASADLLDLSGALTKGAGSEFLFDFVDGSIGETYTLVNFGSTDFAEEDFGISSGIYGEFTLNANNLQFTTMEAPVASVPEPSTFALAALGLFGLIGIGWRKRR